MKTAFADAMSKEEALDKLRQLSDEFARASGRAQLPLWLTLSALLASSVGLLKLAQGSKYAGKFPLPPETEAFVEQVVAFIAALASTADFHSSTRQ